MQETRKEWKVENEIDTIEYFDLFAPGSLFLHAGGYPGCGGGKEQKIVALSQEIAGTQKEIIYFDEKLFIDAQTIGDRLVSPFLDEEVWKRAIQPDQYTSPNEPYVYSTHESVQTLENGKIHQSFRIMREPNQFPELPNVPERPEDTLEGELRSQLDRLAETGEKPPFVRAHIKLHGLPRFNVPARADSPALSQQQKEILKQQRLDVFEERKVLFRNAAESLKTEILAHQGTIDIEDDIFRDWKHMIAYEGSEMSAFRNQCVGVTLNPIQVPPGKSVPTSVFCYYSNRTDREVY